MKLLVIGDVHASGYSLEALLNQVSDLDERVVVFTGDLIDRGPNLRKVMDIVRSNGYLTVLGNHESMLLEHYEHYKLRQFGNSNDDDRVFPTSKTLSAITEDDIRWIKTFPLSLRFKNIIDKEIVITHAPYPFDEFDPSAVDNWNYSPPRCTSIYNIFGHIRNPIPKVYMGRGIGIDTGCAYGNLLTGLLLPEMKTVFQTNVDIIR